MKQFVCAGQNYHNFQFDCDTTDIALTGSMQCSNFRAINGSQLAKMKKSISDMSLS